jgi:hypothetical protein
MSAFGRNVLQNPAAFCDTESELLEAADSEGYRAAMLPLE